MIGISPISSRIHSKILLFALDSLYLYGPLVTKLPRMHLFSPVWHDGQCLQIFRYQWEFWSPAHTLCTSTPSSFSGIPSKMLPSSSRYRDSRPSARRTISTYDKLGLSDLLPQVNCISTEFTPRKHGGEKGVPFRIQVDTFTTNQSGEYMEHVHSSSCQVKVFKVNLISFLPCHTPRGAFNDPCACFCFGSLKEPIANWRRTEKRLIKSPPKTERSISFPMIPHCWRRWGHMFQIT